jgi:hypothetical protein
MTESAAPREGQNEIRQKALREELRRLSAALEK